MPEAPLNDVRRRILASVDEMEAAGPVRRWCGQRIESARRDVDPLDQDAEEPFGYLGLAIL